MKLMLLQAARPALVLAPALKNSRRLTSDSLDIIPPLVCSNYTALAVEGGQPLLACDCVTPSANPMIALRESENTFPQSDLSFPSESRCYLLMSCYGTYAK